MHAILSKPNGSAAGEWWIGKYLKGSLPGHMNELSVHLSAETEETPGFDNLIGYILYCSILLH
jgi:hypothetical protein